MKTTTLILLVFLTGFGLRAQTPPNLRPVPQRSSVPTTNVIASTTPDMSAVPPALPLPSAPVESVAPQSPTGPKEETVPAGDINFQGVDVDQVLDVYARYVGRTLLRAGLPSVKIVLRTETSLTRGEVIQALQGVLALNGIALINVGDKFVKAVPATQAGQEAAAFNKETAAQLPDVGQYITYIVQLQYVKPSEMVPILQPFAKLQNSILSIDSNGILVLRDNVENVKRMLEMIKQVDVTVPAEFISEVIPIKYAMVDDIANALNSLGGTSTAIGNATTPSRTTTMAGGATTGAYQPGGVNQLNQTRATTTPNGTPTSGNTFSQRLNQIIQRAATGTSGQIEILGQTKIIADERSNSLLVFATRQDLQTIKEIVAKLDVLLSQVLIESVIMDVSLGNSWNFGVSAVQNPQTYSPSVPVVGGGGMNNGQPFFNFLQNVASSTTNSINPTGTNLITTIVNTIFSSGAGSGTNGGSFASSVPSGLSYFGNIGPTWNVAVQAAAADSSVTIIQRPRIQTSQAKEAQFFVGSTVPYVNSVYYNSGVGTGASSSYSQMQVGITLDVTPFINPDGLVVMDINQEIDDINGSVAITGVGNVPTTDKRTLSSEVAVKDGDTIILGGFIRTEKDKSKSGIPLLQDIPLLGSLFSQRSSSKSRNELLVLMRPTVLRTPELAAAQTVKEEKRLPGISAAMTDEEAEQRKAAQAEKKKQHSQSQSQDKLFQAASPDSAADTNAVTLPNP